MPKDFRCPPGHLTIIHPEANVLKVREHSELLSAQYLARCLEPENITTRNTPKRRMKETLFTRHRSAVEPIMIARDRKATLQAILTKAVNQDVNSQRRNVVLDDRPPLITISEKELTMKDSYSESILNGTLKAKLNQLYQCQSNILFTTILGHTHGRGVRLGYTRVGAQFNDIPGKERTTLAQWTQSENSAISKQQC